jgi:hypothetical protein
VCRVCTPPRKTRLGFRGNKIASENRGEIRRDDYSQTTRYRRDAAWLVLDIVLLLSDRLNNAADFAAIEVPYLHKSFRYRVDLRPPLIEEPERSLRGIRVATS